MNRLKNMTSLFYAILVISFLFTIALKAQEQPSERENQKRNIGLLLGTHYGSFYTTNTNFVELKLPYLLNNKIEIGAFFTIFGSTKDIQLNPSIKNNFGAFGGVYIAPTIIKFKTSKISVPLALGFGSIGYSYNSSRDIIADNDLEVEDWDPFLLTTIGIALEISISKNSFLTLETTYRSSGNMALVPDYTKNISGITFGLGFKTFLFRI